MKKLPTNLRNLKSKLDKLVPVPVDLSKLSDVVKNDIVKKDVYNARTKKFENKISDITNLATNTTLNAKTNEVKNEIPNITNLATTTALNAKINEAQNKITNIINIINLLLSRIKYTGVSNLVKKN